MRDKVLLSYIIVDGLFVVTGAIMLAFCVIIRNMKFETPTQGDQAARDLVYQQFPLTGSSYLCHQPGLLAGDGELWLTLRYSGHCQLHLHLRNLRGHHPRNRSADA